MSISSLVWNESRPNVSAGFSLKGKATTPKSAPMGEVSVDSSIFRTHTFIKDGTINVNLLPVKLTRKTAFTLKGAGVIGKDYKEGETVVIDMRALPVINRRMVREVSAVELAQKQYDLTCAKAAQRVYNYFAGSKDKAAKAGSYLVSKFGEEGAAWLAEKGLTDKGFAPKTVKAAATDHYIGVELDVSLEGIASLAKVEDVLKKLGAKKELTRREALMLEAINACQDHKAHQTAEDFAEWISKEAKQTVELTRTLMRRIAEIKFSIVIGQVWFKELPTVDDRTLTVDLGGIPTLCEFRKEDKRYEI